jgi:tRNA (mo5U34)-methyltransferase
VDAAFAAHGKFPDWLDTLRNLPDVVPTSVALADGVRVGRSADLTPAQQTQLVAQLRQLHPWRKGPFTLFDLHIDTEWRSDWKWDRIAPHIAPLTGRRILDVGCGNGYHLWRMLAQEPRLLLGLDPFIVYVMQFWAIHQLVLQREAVPIGVIPLGIEALPAEASTFDTVFSMGVLYHRRSPIDHLLELRDALRQGGELVLETLVIDGKLGEVLVPPGRYAQMRNVWFLPSPLTLESWLKKVRFKDVRLVDMTATSADEQRTTDWMTFNSLPDFLHKADPTRTAEGHPAPVRATFVATVR